MPRVDSTAVDRVDYSAGTCTLDVWFKGGAQYSYLDVPPQIYDDLLQAPSVGAFVNQEIKPAFRFIERSRPRRRFRPG